jgi:thiosulfate reductase cytochrome b subunit
MELPHMKIYQVNGLDLWNNARPFDQSYVQIYTAPSTFLLRKASEVHELQQENIFMASSEIYMLLDACVNVKSYYIKYNYSVRKT